MVFFWLVGGADVDEFPVEGAGECVEGLEGDAELEGREHGRRVVAHHDVVDVHLSHLPRELT